MKNWIIKKPRYIKIGLGILVFGIITLSFGQGCSPTFELAKEDSAHLNSLVVVGPPEIMQQPESKSVNEGGTLLLEIRAQANPAPTYQWFKDGQPIAGAFNSRYEVIGVSTSHAGSYSVQVKNIEGSMLSQIAVVSVNTKPEIVSQPIGASVIQGSTHRLMVAVKGTAPFTYQWMFNNQAINGANQDNFTASQAGSYSVLISNAVGSVISQSVNLIVNQPPPAFIAATVSPSMQSLAVNLGSAITMTVTGQGTAPLSYKWTKNNVDLGVSANSLTLAASKEADAGLYSVTVSNTSNGQTFSVVASINLVVNLPPTILQQPMAQTVSEGTNVTMSIVVSGTGPFTYQWRKDGQNITGQTNQNLNLQTVLQNQSGMYSVVVRNAVSMVTSLSAGLTVTALPPTFANAFPIIQAKCIVCHKVGGQASFANFDLKTEAEFLNTQWFKAGNIMSPAILRMQGSGNADSTMPKGGLAWSTFEYNLVKNWILNATPPVIPNNPTFNPAFACSSTSTPTAASIKRLARSHYINSINDFISRIPASTQQALMTSIQGNLNLLPEDSDTVYSRRDNRVTQSHVDTYFNVGYDLSTQIVANTSAINGLVSVCGAGSTKATLGTAACLQSFINYYGRKAFRRPLTSAEVSGLTTFYNSLSGDERIVGLLTRLLSHPQFFYRLDNEGTKVSGTDGVDAIYELSKYEILSKMTFLYWAAPPDDALYTMVSSLDLKQTAAFDQVLDVILKDSRAKNGVLNFYYEWLSLQKTPVFDNTSKPFLAFITGENVNVNGHNHRQDMINEVLDMAQFYTFTTSGRYEDLMKSPYTFTRSQDIAKIYGVSVWDGSMTNLVRFPAEQNRIGLFTRAAFLSANSEYTKPILKGKRIRSQMLCDEIPPPPPSLNIQPLVQDTVTTTAQVVTRTTASSTCMACHSQMNPLGFATESFDSLGRYRAFESKFNLDGTIANKLNVDTNVIAALFPDDNKQMMNPADLANHIADSGKGAQCMVKQFFRYSHDRSEDLVTDGCALESMRNQLMASGGSIFKMLAESARQNTFKQRKVK